MKVYSKTDCKRFVEDMQKNGFKVQHYNAGISYQGPVVIADDIADVKKHTDVQVRSDQLGMSVVVYPLQKDKGKDI